MRSSRSSKRASRRAAFHSIYKFCDKVDLRLLNKRVLESLIKSGAMDSLGRRAQLFAVLDKAMEQAQKAHRDLQAGQHGLFGVFDEQPSAAADALPDLQTGTRARVCKMRRRCSDSSSPGIRSKNTPISWKIYTCWSTAALNAMKRSMAKGEEIFAAGVLGGVRVLKSKRGELYANAALEDMDGRIDAMIFPEAFRRLGEKVKLEVPVLVRGSVRVEEGAAAKLAISEITPLDEAKPKLAKALRLRISLAEASVETVDELHAIFAKSPGEAKVMFDLASPGEFVAVMEAEGYNVLPDRGFIRRVEELCGRGSVVIID